MSFSRDERGPRRTPALPMSATCSSVVLFVHVGREQDGTRCRKTIIIASCAANVTQLNEIANYTFGHFNDNDCAAAAFVGFDDQFEF